MRMKEKKNRKKWLATLLAPSVVITIAVITAAAAVATVAIYHYSGSESEDTISKVVLVPDVAPSLDPKAVEVSHDETSKLSSPEGGGSVSLSYADKINVNLTTGKIQMYFENPAQSNQDLIVQAIITQENNQYLVAQSNTISAGYLLQEMTLDNETKSMLQQGTYKGLFNVLYYNPSTGVKAVVNTNIPITITVTK